MFEVFEDSPAWKWMEESVRQRVREEELKRAEQMTLEELKKAELEILAERQRVEMEILAERKKTLAMLRQTVVELVAQRFPTLVRLAKAQVRPLDQIERFIQVILRLSQAQNSDEAQEVLLYLHEDDDAEHTQEPS
jgi:hypothetical protein